MPLQPFTSNFDDNSTDAGFQFTFFCDQCREGYKTSFVESTTYKKGSFFKGLGGFIGAASSLTGGRLGNLADSLERGTGVIGEKFEGMSPQWHQEHERAFTLAQNEAKGHFFRCPRCKKYVCENDWNEEPSLCVDCAPRESVEVAAARADKMVEDIKAKAASTQVFKGEINARQALCPKCKKPAGEGKFCSNCGASLAMRACSRCGAENASGSFCSECGMKLS
jgi:hypothetical protein